MSEQTFLFETIDNEMAVILNKYLNQVRKHASSGSISFYDAVAMNMVIAESYKFIKQKEEMDESVYYNMEIIRRGLEQRVLLGSLSLFGGLTEVALSVYAVNKQTNYYGKFLDKINILLTSQLLELIDFLYQKKEGFKESDFDAISGLSGIFSYLLLLDGYDEITEKVLELIVHICTSKNVNGLSIPNFHIKNDNMDDISKENYPNGYLNLGLAHGIAGPLVVLSKAYKKGVIVEGQREVIFQIIDIYRKFLIVNGQNIYWPGTLSIEGYLTGAREQKKVREGWCYGGIGIARALLIAADAINDDELREWTLEILKRRAQMGIDEFEMISPTLCHGYAGVLSILNRTVQERGGSYQSKMVETLRNQIFNMFDESSKFGFLDTEIRKNNGEYIKTNGDTCIFLTGASGVILALLSLYNESTLLNSHLLI